MVVKYLGKNIGQERCSKKGIYACLVESTAVEIVKDLQQLFNSSIYRSTNHTEGNTINNKNTIGAMHTQDDMTF